MQTTLVASNNAPLSDVAILAALLEAGGAILCWQVDDEAGFRSAVARGVISFDDDGDCFVHPLAVSLGDCGWDMPQ